MPVQEITVQELKRQLDAGEPITLVDVREPAEYQAANIGGILIPLSQFGARFEELDRKSRLVLHCRSGVRSLNACEFLVSQGFENVTNVKGGILAWAAVVDPSLPQC